jgi:hypothetical protein
VAILVVDRLQVVHVHQDQAGGPLERRADVVPAAERTVERGTVRNPGQAIQPAFDLDFLELLGQLGDTCAQLVKLDLQPLLTVTDSPA